MYDVIVHVQSCFPRTKYCPEERASKRSTAEMWVSFFLKRLKDTCVEVEHRIARAERRVHHICASHRKLRSTRVTAMSQVTGDGTAVTHNTGDVERHVIHATALATQQRWKQKKKQSSNPASKRARSLGMTQFKCIQRECDAMGLDSQDSLTVFFSTLRVSGLFRSSGHKWLKIRSVKNFARDDGLKSGNGD